MVKVSVFYPNDEGKTFDMSYYCDKHIPMVTQLFGTSCTSAAVEQGIADGTPVSKENYFTMVNICFNKVKDIIASLTPHSNSILGDLPTFTDTTPIMTIK